MCKAKLSRREFLRSSLAVLAGTAVAACAPPIVTPVSVPAVEEVPPTRAKAERYTLWFNTLFHSGDAQAMERIVQAYNEEHTDTQLTLTQGQWAEYYAQLTNAVIAGNPPQIGIVHTNKLTEMYPALTPLENTPAGNLLEAAGIKAEDYIETLWQAGERDGHRYLVPLDTHMWGMWYNRQIFQEAGLDPDDPPQTMDTVTAAADAIRDKGYYAWHPAEDALPRKLERAWYIFFWQQGGELFDPDYTQVTFNDEKGLTALRFLVSIVQEHKWNEPGTDGFKQFTAGQLGILFAGNWMYWTAVKSEVDWGFAYIPQFYDKRVTWANSHNMVIPKQPSGVSAEVLIKSAEAIKWINEHSDLWGIYGGHIPAYKPVLNSKALQESDTWKRSLSKFVDMANKGWIHYPIDHPKGSLLENAIQVQVQEAYNGTKSPEEALQAAADEATQILQSA